jgi:hypothetical protein
MRLPGSRIRAYGVNTPQAARATGANVVIVKTNIKTHLRDANVVPAKPKAHNAQDLSDSLSGGYSVWACPPKKEFQPSVPAKAIPRSSSIQLHK